MISISSRKIKYIRLLMKISRVGSIQNLTWSLNLLDIPYKYIKPQRNDFCSFNHHFGNIIGTDDIFLKPAYIVPRLDMFSCGNKICWEMAHKGNEIAIGPSIQEISKEKPQNWNSWSPCFWFYTLCNFLAISSWRDFNIFLLSLILTYCVTTTKIQKTKHLGWAKGKYIKIFKKEKKAGAHQPTSIFYIPDGSPWPLFVGFSTFSLLCMVLIWSEKYVKFDRLFFFASVWISITLLWFMDLHWERGAIGISTFEIDDSLKYSMVIFIGRESIFFFGFFFRFFSLRRCPELSTGREWPPVAIRPIRPMGIPLLNTFLLLRRGIFLTWRHKLLLSYDWEGRVLSLGITILLAICFSLLQLKEYKDLRFGMNDSFFGSIFYMATGFHGFHVILGSIMLLACLKEIAKGNVLAGSNHVLLEIRAWYWHFVDVVWIFLYLFIYYSTFS